MIQLISAQFLFNLTKNCFKTFAAIQIWMLPDLNKRLHTSSFAITFLGNSYGSYL